MTILGAERVFGFILGILAAQKTPFAELLRESLLLRISEREEITNWLVSSSIYIVAKNTTIMQRKIYQHFQQNQP